MNRLVLVALLVAFASLLQHRAEARSVDCAGGALTLTGETGDLTVGSVRNCVLRVENSNVNTIVVVGSIVSSQLIFRGITCATATSPNGACCLDFHSMTSLINASSFVIDNAQMELNVTSSAFVDKRHFAVACFKFDHSISTGDATNRSTLSVTVTNSRLTGFVDTTTQNLLHIAVVILGLRRGALLEQLVATGNALALRPDGVLPRGAISEVFFAIVALHSNTFDNTPRDIGALVHVGDNRIVALNVPGFVKYRVCVNVLSQLRFPVRGLGVKPGDAAPVTEINVSGNAILGAQLSACQVHIAVFCNELQRNLTDITVLRVNDNLVDSARATLLRSQTCAANFTLFRILIVLGAEVVGFVGDGAARPARFEVRSNSLVNVATLNELDQTNRVPKIPDAIGGVLFTELDVAAGKQLLTVDALVLRNWSVDVRTGCELFGIYVARRPRTHPTSPQTPLSEFVVRGVLLSAVSARFGGDGISSVVSVADVARNALDVATASLASVDIADCALENVTVVDTTRNFAFGLRVCVAMLQDIAMGPLSLRGCGVRGVNLTTLQPSTESHIYIAFVTGDAVQLSTLLVRDNRIESSSLLNSATATTAVVSGLGILRAGARLYAVPPAPSAAAALAATFIDVINNTIVDAQARSLPNSSLSIIILFSVAPPSKGFSFAGFGRIQVHSNSISRFRASAGDSCEVNILRTASGTANVSVFSFRDNTLEALSLDAAALVSVSGASIGSSLAGAQLVEVNANGISGVTATSTARRVELRVVGAERRFELDAGATFSAAQNAVSRLALTAGTDCFVFVTDFMRGLVLRDGARIDVRATAVSDVTTLSSTFSAANGRLAVFSTRSAAILHARANVTVAGSRLRDITVSNNRNAVVSVVHVDDVGLAPASSWLVADNSVARASAAGLRYACLAIARSELSINSTSSVPDSPPATAASPSLPLGRFHLAANSLDGLANATSDNGGPCRAILYVRSGEHLANGVGVEISGDSANSVNVEMLSYWPRLSGFFNKEFSIDAACGQESTTSTTAGPTTTTTTKTTFTAKPSGNASWNFTECDSASAPAASVVLSPAAAANFSGAALQAQLRQDLPDLPPISFCRGAASSAELLLFAASTSDASALGRQLQDWSKSRSAAQLAALGIEALDAPPATAATTTTTTAPGATPSPRNGTSNSSDRDRTRSLSDGASNRNATANATTTTSAAPAPLPYISPLRFVARKSMDGASFVASLRNPSASVGADRARLAMTAIANIKDDACAEALSEDELRESAPDVGESPLQLSLGRGGFKTGLVVGNAFVFPLIVFVVFYFGSVLLWSARRWNKAPADRAPFPGFRHFLLESKVLQFEFAFFMMLLGPTLTACVELIFADFVEPGVRFVLCPLVIVLTLLACGALFWKLLFKRKIIETWVRADEQDDDDDDEDDQQRDSAEKKCVPLRRLFAALLRLWGWLCDGEFDVEIPDAPRARRDANDVDVTADDIAQAKLAFCLIEGYTARMPRFVLWEVGTTFVFALSKFVVQAVGGGAGARAACVADAVITCLVLLAFGVVVVVKRPHGERINKATVPLFCAVQIGCVVAAALDAPEDAIGAMMVLVTQLQALVSLILLVDLAKQSFEEGVLRAAQEHLAALAEREARHARRLAAAEAGRRDSDDDDDEPQQQQQDGEAPLLARPSAAPVAAAAAASPRRPAQPPPPPPRAPAARRQPFRAAQRAPGGEDDDADEGDELEQRPAARAAQRSRQPALAAPRARSERPASPPPAARKPHSGGGGGSANNGAKGGAERAAAVASAASAAVADPATIPRVAPEHRLHPQRVISVAQMMAMRASGGKADMRALLAYEEAKERRRRDEAEQRRAAAEAAERRAAAEREAQELARRRAEADAAAQRRREMEAYDECQRRWSAIVAPPPPWAARSASGGGKRQASASALARLAAAEDEAASQKPQQQQQQHAAKPKQPPPRETLVPHPLERGVLVRLRPIHLILAQDEDERARKAAAEKDAAEAATKTKQQNGKRTR